MTRKGNKKVINNLYQTTKTDIEPTLYPYYPHEIKTKLVFLYNTIFSGPGTETKTTGTEKDS